MTEQSKKQSFYSFIKSFLGFVDNNSYNGMGLLHLQRKLSLYGNFIVISLYNSFIIKKDG